MKKIFGLVTATFVIVTFLTGCLNIQGGHKNEMQKPTVGQQLMDLQKARNMGAITEQEYQALRVKVLENK